MQKLFVLILCCFLGACATSNSAMAKKTVKPRFHKGYYKKHVYHKKLQWGRFRIRWFEKQGVKEVKKV